MAAIAVVIPAYNEGENLTSLIAELNVLKKSSGLDLDPVVVNDCSTDNTLAIASKLDCLVLNLPINLGIGGAVQTGVRYAFEHGYDLAIQVDGDGQHPPAEIPKLVKAITESGSDVVIGSRFIDNLGFRSTFLRRIVIRYFRCLIKLFSGQDITDCTSGFRALDRKAMALVSDYYPDEYPEPESILYFAVNVLKIGEIPVVMRARSGGRSSIRNFASLYYVLKGTLAIFFTFVKLRSWKISYRPKPS
jgi:glycosyltransferase involved in cell wall biosynthesis